MQDNGTTCPTITAESNGICKIDIENASSLRIRKLTPRECFRLMGFNDDDFEKVASLNSDTQLYKQAGNSVVVNVIENILISLFRAI